MTAQSVEERMLQAGAALDRGRWTEARDAYAVLLEDTDSAAALMGLAQAQWWLGQTAASVRSATHAFAASRRSDDIEGAVQAAAWLALTYKANYESDAVAQGWLRRAERLLVGRPPGPLHAWTWIVQAYRHSQLVEADELTRRAVDVARSIGDIDLELVGLSQLGRVLVGMGRVAEGFALIDEAMAATSGGEWSRLDTVVYVCCDMLSACDLANDANRASQWCRVADDFIATYGCPFLNGECRTLYGGLLVATGRWEEASHELAAALRITLDCAPRLYAQATVRLASLRIRQGHAEEAAALIEDLDVRMAADAEAALVRAALYLARGDSPAACRVLTERVGPSGAIVGVDLNEAMLTVARRVAPELEWRSGDAGALPFDAATFDVVLCQMALMFFPDRRRAVAEMARVARPGGRVGICVPASLPDQPAYRVFVDIAGRHAGVEAMSLLGTYWSCGDIDELTGLLEDAGLAPQSRATTTGTAHFSSVEGFVATEVDSTPLAGRISEKAYSLIVADATSELARYETADQRFDVPLVGHVIVGSVPLAE